jgi:hypothetical protein
MNSEQFFASMGMRQDQFQQLVQTKAISRITLWGKEDGWEIWAYCPVDPDPDNLTGGSSLSMVRPPRDGLPGIRLQTTRGGFRTFASLDSAYRWLFSIGAVHPHVTVQIQGMPGA